MGIPVRSPVTTEADGEITVSLGAESGKRWNEITVRVFDGSNNPVTTATGTLSAKAIKSGTDKPEDFEETIDLSSDPWSWRPEMSTVRAFIFSVSGLNAGYSYQITINNWSSV